MAQGYVASVCSTIRRLAEAPKKNPPKKATRDSRLCISLVILLREVQANAGLFTRARLRNIYIRHNRQRPDVFERVADQVFNAVVKNSRAKCLSPARIDKDVKTINRVTKSIERFVSKKIAHHERFLRFVGRPVRFGEIDRAIKLLLEFAERYSLFVLGQWCNPSMAYDHLDIRPDLKRLWPDAIVPTGW
jgi:hypothetical protein